MSIHTFISNQPSNCRFSAPVNILFGVIFPRSNALLSIDHRWVWMSFSAIYHTWLSYAVGKLVPDTTCPMNKSRTEPLFHNILYISIFGRNGDSKFSGRSSLVCPIPFCDRFSRRPWPYFRRSDRSEIHILITILDVIKSENISAKSEICSWFIRAIFINGICRVWKMSIVCCRETVMWGLNLQKVYIDFMLPVEFMYNRIYVY